jgi:hypothetical protein
VLASGQMDEIHQRFRRGGVVRVTVLGGDEEIGAAQRFFAAQREVASSELLPDGRIEIGLPGSEDEAAALLGRAVGAGHRVASFAPAVSDLEELFLQITASERESTDGVPAHPTEVAA